MCSSEAFSSAGSDCAVVQAGRVMAREITCSFMFAAEASVQHSVSSATSTCRLRRIEQAAEFCSDGCDARVAVYMKRKYSCGPDGLAVGYAKPAQAASNSFDLPAGPRSYTELFEWPLNVAQRAQRMIQDNGWAMRKEIKVVVTTAFSGVGMAEIAAKCVKDALQRIGLHVHLDFYAATDICAICQDLLQSQHVFADLLERADSSVWSHLLELQSGILSEVTEKCKKLSGKAQTEAWQTANARFFQAATSFLDGQAASFVDRAYCVKCDGYCRWVPDRDPGTLWLDCGGNVCTPFSTRGNNKKWLDKANLPLFAWCYSMKHVAQPDFILNECVSSMPINFFRACFGNTVSISPVNFSPTDLGFPVNRPRQYVVLKFSAEAPKIALTKDTLAEVAFRTLECAGSVLLQASKEDVRKFAQQLAEQRKIFVEAGDPIYKMKLVMDVADRQRAEAFRAALLDRGLPAHADYIADVAQTVQFGTVATYMPTVIRNSRMYSFASDRLVLPAELLAAQGLPVGQGLLCCEHVPSAIRELPNVRRCREVTQLLGNCMHLCQVGVCLTILLLDAAVA